MKRILSAVLAVLCMFGFAAISQAEGEYISVISKGEQHAFWQAVHKGANDAAAQYGVVMQYYGPPSEADSGLQVAALKAEMEKNPIAIALAAIDTASVMTELQTCIEKGIPVIGFDSGVPNAPSGAIYATAQTDNRKAGALAAEKLAESEGFSAMLGEGTADAPVVIAVLSQDVTSESVAERTGGFVDRMKELAGALVAVTGHALWAEENAGATVVIHVQVGATSNVGDMTAAALAVLDTENLRALFCTNEGAVTGLLAATNGGEELGDKDLRIVGFDAGAAQKNAVRNGWFIGSVTQDPYMIGYLAVELAVQAANGEPVEDVDTGALWYTAENIDDPEIALLVYD